MKRRRNADDTLRKLERLAFTEGSPEAIKAYWRKALQAGQLPKPTFVDRGCRFGWTYNVNNPEAELWPDYEFPAQLPRVIWHRYHSILEGGATNVVFLQLPGKDRVTPGYFNRPEQAEEFVKKALLKLITEENPRRRPRCRRRNSDDLLRKLERKAFETQDPQDIIAYWRVAMRAAEPGVVPRPTAELFSGSSKLASRVYTLYPREYAANVQTEGVSWRQLPPRIVEWQRDDFSLLDPPWMDLFGRVSDPITDFREQLQYLIDIYENGRRYEL